MGTVGMAGTRRTAPAHAQLTSSGALTAPAVWTHAGNVTVTTTAWTPATSWLVCVTPPKTGHAQTAAASTPRGAATGTTTVETPLMSKAARPSTQASATTC